MDRTELAERASGVILTRVAGADLEDRNEREALARLRPAGITLFAENVEDPARARELVREFDALFGAPPPIVAIDQEGGRVARLRAGAVEMPSMMAVGATRDVALAARAGERIGRDVRAIGANVDFAPVLDVASEPRNTAIGRRAFGDDPQTVAAFGVALVDGLGRAGIAAVPKHFPGHGATLDDSHVSLPVLRADRATIVGREFVPFAAAFEHGARAVMTAHVVVPAFDPEMPATLSLRVLGAELRERLGFRGIVFTDALEMAAIRDRFGVARGAVLAIAAGADVVTACESLDDGFAIRDALVAAVERGELPERRLRDAADAVARFRWSLANESFAPTSDDDGVGREIARRAVTLVRGEPRLDPQRAIAVVAFAGTARGGAEDAAAEHSLGMALRRRRFRTEHYNVPLEPDDAMISHLTSLLGSLSQRRVIVEMRRAHLYPAQARAIERVLATAGDAVVASMWEPFDLDVARAASTLFCTYGDEGVMVDALADVLAGAVAPAGELPVRSPARA